MLEHGFKKRIPDSRDSGVHRQVHYQEPHPTDGRRSVRTLPYFEGHRTPVPYHAGRDGSRPLPSPDRDTILDVQEENGGGIT